MPPDDEDPLMTAPTGVRYQPDETPPKALAFGLGFQLAVLAIAGIVLTPIIVIRAAGGDDRIALAFLSRRGA